MGDDDRFFVLNTGAKIPSVGLGTWESKGEACEAAVASALASGYRHIDCSHLYGNEIQVGQALAKNGISRSELFITSKLWITSNTPRHVDSAINVSLRNLGLSNLDLYLLHWPVVAPIGDATDPPRKALLEQRELSKQIKGTWQAMESLVGENGKVRAIGVSNFDVSQLEEVLSFCKVVPAVNQVELHPFWRQDELVKYCKSKGIHVSAHTPLGVPGNSIVPGSTSGEATKQLPGYSRSQSSHAPLLKASLVGAIAERLGKTPAQILLRWAVQRGTSVLPRSLSPDQIKSNIDILGWSLPESDWNAINSMEPQRRLISGTYSYLSENAPLQLQAVDDNDPVENI